MSASPGWPSPRTIVWLRAAALVVVLGIGLGVLYVVSPEDAPWLPKCPLYAWTGWYCPGCGSTRAAHALLHGDLSGAFAKNPLIIGAALPAAAWCIWQRRRLGPGWTTAISVRTILLILAVLVAYGVLRNVPAYPFDLLAPH